MDHVWQSIYETMDSDCHDNKSEYIYITYMLNFRILNADSFSKVVFLAQMMKDYITV